MLLGFRLIFSEKLPKSKVFANFKFFGRYITF